MDTKRAKQIMTANKKTQVYYKNTPVKIMSVDHQSGSVELKNLKNDKTIVSNAKTIHENHGLKH